MSVETIRKTIKEEMGNNDIITQFPVDNTNKIKDSTIHINDNAKGLLFKHNSISNSIIKSDFAFQQRLTLKNCVCKNQTYINGNFDFDRSEFDKARIVQKKSGDFISSTNSTIKNTELQTEGFTIENSTVDSSSIHVFGFIGIEDCEFDNVVIVSTDIISFSKCDFQNCKIDVKKQWTFSNLKLRNINITDDNAEEAGAELL
jgi:hypothetical protein